MNVDDSLAEEAENELGMLKKNCEDLAFSEDARNSLWEGFRRWTSHPVFRQYPGMLRCRVLNELQFTLSVDELRDGAWQLLGELAEHWERDSLGGLMDAIRIASFECIAEAPESPEDLVSLFALAAKPHTRWAVFAAYENVPWRLRPHAHKYANGLISDEDCDEWFIRQNRGDDEVLMHKPRKRFWQTDDPGGDEP